MLNNFKAQIEAMLGEKVDDLILMRAIEKAKSEIVANYLLIGQDVTAAQFRETVVRCIWIITVKDAELISRR